MFLADELICEFHENTKNIETIMTSIIRQLTLWAYYILYYLSGF